MSKVVVSLATRNRPDKLINTIKRTVANIALRNTVLVVQVDDDDQLTLHEFGKHQLPPCVQLNVKPREDTVAEKFERALSIPADVYVTMADEHPIITPGFDVKMLEGAARLPDRLGWIYGHCANASFPASAAVPVQFVEKIGFLYPKHFPYWFVDHWVDDVVRIMGRISYVDVMTDQTGAGGRTQELREPGWWATFYDAAYLTRRKQAHDIINSPEFQSPPWLKDLLLQHHPMIEFRSRWINSGVRAQNRELSGMNGNLNLLEPRYVRKKEEAVKLIPHLLNGYGMDPQEVAMFRDYLLPPTNIVNLKQAFA